VGKFLRGLAGGVCRPGNVLELAGGVGVLILVLVLVRVAVRLVHWCRHGGSDVTRIQREGRRKFVMGVRTAVATAMGEGDLYTTREGDVDDDTVRTE